MENKDDTEPVTFMLAALEGSPIISRMTKDWLTLANELCVPNEVIQVIRSDFLCGLTHPEKILNTILLNWRSRCGSKANIATFIKVVEEKCNWIGIGAQITRNLQIRQRSDFTDSTKWKELKICQRADMLSKDVVMLGRRGPLIEIAKEIPACDFSQILEECLNGGLLVSFLESRAFKLVSVMTPAKIPYYVKRKLVMKNVINTKLFSSALVDLFVIEGIDRPSLQLLVPFQHTDVSGNQLMGLTCRFILLEDPEHFQRICNLTRSTIHYIQFKMGYFIHVQTHGNIANIQKFLHTSQTNIDEDTFVGCNLSSHRSEIILLSGISGAGKSTFLAKVAHKIEQLYKDRLVVYVDIYQFFLYQNDRECTKEDFLKALAKYLSRNELGFKILLRMLTNKICLVELFLDGFDNLSVDTAQHAHQILLYVSGHFKHIRIFVTANGSLNEDLHTRFGQIQFELVELKQTELTQLQCMYWSHFKNIDVTEHLNKYSETVLKLLSETSNNNFLQVVGTPMMATILAKTYEDYVPKISLNCNQFINFRATHASISMIYQNFINTKLVKSANIRNAVIQMALDHIFLRTVPEKNHQIVVGYNISEEDLLATKLFQRQQLNDEVQFAHQSFVDFLVGIYLTDSLSAFSNGKGNFQKPMQLTLSLLQTVSVNDKCRFNYTSFCTVFNSMLFESSIIQSPNDLKLAEKIVNQIQNVRNILLACLSSRLYAIFCLIMHGLPETTIIRTIEISSIELVKILDIASQLFGIALVPQIHNRLFLLTKADVRDINLGIYEPLNIKWTPIHFAAQKGNLNLFEYLLKAYVGLEVPQFLVHAIVNNSKNDLADILETKVKLLKYFGQERLRSNCVEEASDTLPVPILLKNINVKLLKCLIENGANVYATDVNLNTLAHIISAYLSPDEYHNFVQVLLNRDAGALFRQLNNNNQTAIEFALAKLKIRPETIKLLLTSKEIILNDDHKLIHLLIRFGYDSSVIDTAMRYSYNNQLSSFKDGSTSHLHVASYWQNVEVLKYFLQLGVQVNIRDKYGMTPLHIVCTDKSFYCCENNKSGEVVSLLLEHGADVTLLDNNGREAMSYLLDHTCQFSNLILN